MTDRLRPPDERQVEGALRDLGARLAYPPTPDLARLVRARLAAPPPRRSRWSALLARPAARRLALALVLLVVLAGAVLALSPAARNAVAGRLGVPGINITFVTPVPTVPLPTATVVGPTATGGVTRTPATPTATALASATPVVIGTPATAAATPVVSPTSVGARLFLGQPVTLDTARARVLFPVRVPTLPELGAPDEVYFGTPPPDGQVSFVWRARPWLPPVAETGVGLLLSQFRGDLAPNFGQKGLGGSTGVEFLTVNGVRGIWISGDLHQFGYTDAGGQYRNETTRLAGNVLLWEQGGVTFRLEGARTKEEALRIAASLR